MSVAFWFSYILLWVTVAVLVVGMFALYHHFGQMYISSPSGKQEQGPKLGSYFKPVTSVDIQGNTLVVPLQHRPMLVVFASTDCPLCAQLRDVLSTFVRTATGVAVVVYCDGSPRAVQAWAGDLVGIVDVVADRRGRVAVRNGIDATPFVVAVGRDGLVRAKGIVNDIEGLEHFAQDAAALPVLQDAN